MARIDSKIVPCLWFDDQAEDAARFYASVFPASSIGQVLRYTREGVEIHGKPPGSVLTVEVVLDGAPLTLMNGGPLFKFSEAVSLQVLCDSQAEIDHYWNGLTADGGQESQCGWLKDKYGMSWQVVPSGLDALWSDPQRAERVMAALMKMTKLDVAALERAARGA